MYPLKEQVTVSMLVNAEKKYSLSPADSAGPHDLERALAEAAEEMDFDCPEFLPVERIKDGITEIVLGFLLVAGLLAFFSFLSWCPL
jgi:hypothetical protein